MMVRVFCINLERDVHRRRTMEQIAAEHSFPFEFIDAVAGAEISPDQFEQFGYDRNARNRAYADLEKNEVACLLSHKKALNRFLEGNDEYCVVLEDDAGLSPDFDEAVSYLTQRVTGWDLIKLECRTRSPQGYPIMKLEISHPLILFSPLRSSLGATGILYSREGARKLLHSLSRFHHAFDTHLGFGWKYDLHAAEVFPSLVYERKDGLSSIGGRTGKTRRKSPQAWLLARQERMIHSFMKRVFALRAKRAIRKI